MNSTGEMIKKIRKNAGLSQEELGNMLGVGKDAVQKYENGGIINIKMDVIRQFCISFNVPPMLLVFPEYAHYLMMHIEEWDFESTKMGLMLNREGRDKLKQYISDLSLIEKYRAIPMCDPDSAQHDT